MKINSSLSGLGPELIAKHIIKELGLNIREPTDLYYVACRLNIVVRKKKIAKGILGACKVVGLKRLVIIDPEIVNIGRERFTLAHEIGHIVLRHGMRCCRKEDFFWDSKKTNIEHDANLFAAELLMPTDSLKDIAQQKDITLDLIEEIASERNVSKGTQGDGSFVLT
ncbi:ImmA/IrrE family metallo-endopeptidase [bacterium AH-315-E09]|jgi:Zn-dependent peptidase ImmA (M78 family)|nr:ImmA/IrrE family metallo-endopeptidase [bacterium AH-315-E09]